jgi:hypothetical protein
MNLEKLHYQITNDLGFLAEAEKTTLEETAKRTGISRSTLYAIKAGKAVDATVLEKFYTFAYENKYRLNPVKEELLEESSKKSILFHGSKNGLKAISVQGSRESCDFGHGFYLSESYESALAFVCENEDSSVYSFRGDFTGLKIKRFDCSLEWMLAVCHYRRTLAAYDHSKLIQEVVREVEAADLVIAPIADNRMFYIMSLFAEGDINADVALHSLSASKLGLQYIVKREKALHALEPIEKYYLCRQEKADCQEKQKQRVTEIDTKLKLARREYKTGLFVEELLK